MDNSLIYSVGSRAATPPRGRGTNGEASLEPNDRALAAITDFMHDRQVTAPPDLPIRDALVTMICASVHALVVTQDAIDRPDQLVVGLITSRAIQNTMRRRFQHMDVRVSDVMTPWIEMPLIHYESLLSLTVHDLYERFQGTGLTHFLIVESDGHDFTVARGLVSRAAVARRLQSTQAAAV
jgi:CBS domain-containing protein